MARRRARRVAALALAALGALGCEPVPAPPAGGASLPAPPIVVPPVVNDAGDTPYTSDRDAGPSPPDAPQLEIASDRVGPFHVGLPRDEVLRLLAAPLPSGGGAPARAAPRLRRARPRLGVTLRERATFAPEGRPLLELLLEDGELTEIQVVAADPRVVTDAGIGVGATLERAAEVYGPGRPIAEAGLPRALLFADLPGVLFRPNPSAPARVGTVLVVGPEATRPAD